jgi:hypothetical protein
MRRRWGCALQAKGYWFEPVAPTKRDTSNVIMELAGSDAGHIADPVASRSPPF